MTDPTPRAGTDKYETAPCDASGLHRVWRHDPDAFVDAQASGGNKAALFDPVGCNTFIGLACADQVIGSDDRRGFQGKDAVGIGCVRIRDGVNVLQGVALQCVSFDGTGFAVGQENRVAGDLGHVHHRSIRGGAPRDGGRCADRSVRVQRKCHQVGGSARGHHKLRSGEGFEDREIGDRAG